MLYQSNFKVIKVKETNKKNSFNFKTCLQNSIPYRADLVWVRLQVQTNYFNNNRGTVYEYFSINCAFYEFFFFMFYLIPGRENKLG